MNNLERKFTIYNFIKKSEIDVEDLLIGLNQQEAEKFKALIDNSLFKDINIHSCIRFRWNSND